MPNGRAGDWTQSLPHVERAWYHYTKHPRLKKANGGYTSEIHPPFYLWSRGVLGTPLARLLGSLLLPWGHAFGLPDLLVDWVWFWCFLMSLALPATASFSFAFFAWWDLRAFGWPGIFFGAMPLACLVELLVGWGSSGVFWSLCAAWPQGAVACFHNSFVFHGAVAWKFVLFTFDPVAFGLPAWFSPVNSPMYAACFFLV